MISKVGACGYKWKMVHNMINTFWLHKEKASSTRIHLSIIKYMTMVFTKGLTVLALIGLSICTSISIPPPNFQLHSGFEFLATVEGKVFVQPIKASSGTDDLTYQEAIAKCVSAGYRIATIETAAQNAAVEQYTCQDNNFRWSWIDGVDFQIPDAFFSINTGKNLTYFNWSKWGQRPVIGKDDRNCLRLSCNTIEGPAWWDVECTDKYSVICEVNVA